MRAVLVTGGAGFIGANLVRAFLQKNISIHCILKPTTNMWRLTGIEDKIHIHHVSLLDKDGIATLITKIQPDAIVHLASYGNGAEHTSVDRMIETNIESTLHLLQALEYTPRARFINIGSSSEFGIHKRPMREDSPCTPVSFYGATKLSGTHLGRVFADTYQQSVVTIRPFSVYGPYEHNGRFIPTIVRAVLTQKPITITAGDVRHDFIYVDDLISLIILVAEGISNVPSPVYNAGTGKEYTNEEVVASLFTAAGKKVPVQKGAYTKRAWDAPHWVADMSRVKKELSWKPKYSLEEGLKKTLEWFKENKKLYEKN